MVKYTSPSNTAISDTPPAESDGKVWVDTSQDPPKMKLYDSATGAFIPASAKETIVSQTEPTPERGKIWFEPEPNGISVYKGLPAEWEFLEFLSDIPDSVVSRPADTSVGDSSNDVGTVLDFNIEWPAETIDCELSSGTNNAQFAEIVELSSVGSKNGTTIESKDITSLSGGDQFTFNLSQKLTTSGEYAFVVGRNDSTNVDQARYDASSGGLPITSSDGNLEMVDGILIGSKRDNRLNAFKQIGNLS